METKLTDIELIQAILDKNQWTHQTLADHLRFDRTQVSRVLSGKTRLRPLTREKAEQLLQDTKQQD